MQNHRVKPSFTKRERMQVFWAYHAALVIFICGSIAYFIWKDFLAL